MKKKVKIIPDISAPLVSKRAKELSTPEMKVTFNDVLMTAISKSIHDYLLQYTPKVTKDKVLTEIMLACPFSLRPPPKELGDYKFNNDFSIVPLNLKLVSSMSGIKQINRDMNALKKSVEPIGLCYLVKFTMMLPDFLRTFLLEMFLDRMTFGFSNVPGPKTPWVLTGKRC